MNLDIYEKSKIVKKKLRRLEGLPTLPPIVQRLNKLIENEETSFSQIAELIEKDQVITSKILRLANSAFYGFPKKISTVQNALVLLGVNIIKVLIITSSIFEIIYKEDVSLWEHSIGVATCARILAEKLEIKEPQEIATAGLLHDLGKIVEKVSFKVEYKKMEELVQEGKTSLLAEKEIFGLDHAEMGAFLMKIWNLPDRLIEAVGAHHELEKAKNFKKESALIHLANILIHARGYGNSLYKKVPSLDQNALKILNFNLSETKEIFLILEPKLYELKFFTEELKKDIKITL